MGGQDWTILQHGVLIVTLGEPCHTPHTLAWPLQFNGGALEVTTPWLTKGITTHPEYEQKGSYLFEVDHPAFQHALQQFEQNFQQAAGPVLREQQGRQLDTYKGRLLGGVAAGSQCLKVRLHPQCVFHDEAGHVMHRHEVQALRCPYQARVTLRFDHVYMDYDTHNWGLTLLVTDFACRPHAGTAPEPAADSVHSTSGSRGYSWDRY